MNTLRQLVLHWLRVPPEPAPPAGAPGSLQVFRAGRRYLQWRRLVWLLRQVVTLVGVVAGVVFLRSFWEQAPPKLTGAHFLGLSSAHWLVAFEALGLVGFLLQIPFTYAMLQLDYELRWYMVTDRSLRIRDGLTRIRELTLSFANIQQITVRQDPLQRLLGLADVVVTTAGGGGTVGPGPGHNPGQEPAHTGVLRAVDNAGQVRDLMVERLRRFRDTGLGDPEEAGELVEAGRPSDGPGGEAVLVAAREALAEARALRHHLEGGIHG